MRKFMKSQKGFTLVELLIVVVILGILAAVAIPRFLTTRDEAQLRTCQANMAAINGAVEEYCFKHNVQSGAADGVLSFALSDDPSMDVDTLFTAITGNLGTFPDGPPACPAHSATGDTTHIYSLALTGRAACGTGAGGDDTGHGVL